jgi:hypothetical protein
MSSDPFDDAAASLVELHASSIINAHSQPSASSQNPTKKNSSRKNRHNLPTREAAFTILSRFADHNQGRSIAWLARVVETYPDLLLRRGPSQLLFLHTICLNPSGNLLNVERVKIALSYSPREQLLARSDGNDTPFTLLAARQIHEQRPEVIELFLRACTESAFLPQNDDWTPLRLLCENTEAPVLSTELLAFEQHAPLAFLTEDSQRESLLDIWVRTRRGIFYRRGPNLNLVPPDEKAEQLKRYAALDADAVACMHILLRMDPPACARQRHQEWPHEQLAMDDPTRAILVDFAKSYNTDPERAIFFDVATICAKPHKLNLGSTILEYLVNVSSTTGSILPILRRVLQEQPELANVRSIGFLSRAPLQLLLTNADVTFEQLLLLYHASSKQIQADMLHSDFFCEIIAAPSEADRWGSKASGAASLLLGASSSSSSPPIDGEQQRFEFIQMLLKSVPWANWAEQVNHAGAYPLWFAIKRESCTAEQLELLWNATPLLQRQQAAKKGVLARGSILADLIFRLATAPSSDLTESQVKVLSVAQRLLHQDCIRALSHNIDTSTASPPKINELRNSDPEWMEMWFEDPTRILVDYALLLLPLGQVDVVSVLDRIFLEPAIESNPSPGPLKLKLRPPSDAALTHRDEGSTLFLYRLTQHNVPLGEAEVRWFAKHAPFVFEQRATCTFSGASNASYERGLTTPHLMVQRADCTPMMMEIAIAAGTNAWDLSPIARRSGISHRLPLDQLLVSPRSTVGISSAEDEETFCQIICILLGQTTKPRENEKEGKEQEERLELIRGETLPTKQELLMKLLAAPLSDPSTPSNEPFNRPIHSYLRYVTNEPLRRRILHLLVTGQGIGASSSSTSIHSSYSQSLSNAVLTAKNSSNQTPLVMLCANKVLLTLEELEWMISIAPDIVPTLFAPKDGLLFQLANNPQLTLPLWKRALECIKPEALLELDRGTTHGRALAASLCRTHPNSPDLFIALIQRAPDVFLHYTKVNSPLEGLTHYPVDVFEPIMIAFSKLHAKNLLLFDALSCWTLGTPCGRHSFWEDSDLASSRCQGSNQDLLPIRWLQRVPNLKSAQLHSAPWPAYLSHLVRFAMESEEHLTKVLDLFNGPDPARVTSSRTVIVSTLHLVALLSGGPILPRMIVQGAKAERGWLAGSRQFRWGEPLINCHYAAANLLDQITRIVTRAMAGPKTRRTFLGDLLPRGMVFNIAITPSVVKRVVEAFCTQAIHLEVTGLREVASEFTLPQSWLSLIGTTRGRFVFTEMLMQLIRSKERKLIVKLIHLVSPFRVSSLRCSIHYSSPLHILCSEVRGCRERIFEILLADALQLYNGSYEKVLDELDGDGNSLRSILEHHKNRDLLSHIQYSMNRKSTVGVAAPLHASAAATFFASALGTTESSAPSHSVSVRLRSRSNYLTYDRIVDLSLESCLDQPTSNQPQVDSGKLDFSSIVDSTLARSLSICSLPSLLSSDECSRLLSCTGFNFDSLSGEYHPRQRDSSRLLCHAPQFTEMIWNRLYANSTFTKFLSHQTEIDRRPMGYGTFGLWIPEKINEIVRFSYYQPGSMGFQPHRDAAFVQSTNERSIYTILIYLTQPTDQPSIPSTQATVAASQVNDDVSVVASPSSGSTTFYESTNFMPGGLVRDERPIEVLTIPSTIGRTILFPHELLHSGNPIDTNDLAGKCVIRLDLIFRRSSSSIPLVPLEFHWRHDPNYLRALELFQFAFKLELSGREDEASDAYERSLSLRVAPIMRRAKKPIDRRASPNSSPDDSSSIASNSESSETPNRLSINESSFAFDVNRDCLRLIYSYLNTEDQTSTRATCQRWYAPLSIISNPSANQPQVNPKKSAIKANEALWPQKLFQSKAPLSPVSGGVTSMSSGPIAHPAVSIAVVSSNHMMNAVSSLPSLLQPLSAVINENNPTKIEVQPRSFPPSYYAHLERQAYEHSRLHPTPDVNAYLGSSLSSRLLLFPRLSQVGGISTLMSYPTDFYLRHESACRRVMSLYAALTLSHHLPLIVNLMPNLYETKQRERAWTPLTPKELLEAEKLLAARIVFSYERGGNGSSNGSIDNNDKENDSASHVEWCRFDSLIHGIFHGNHITTNITTIEQFNQQTTDKQPFQSIKLAQRLFTYGERSISSGSERSRWSIALGNGIIPSFYHASMCCSQQHAGRHARHELHCYDKQDMLIRKKAQQAASRRAIRVSNAEEVRTLDLAAKSDLIKTLAHSNTDSSASSSSSANLPIDSSTMDVASTSSSPLPVLITVQSMRSSRFISNFRVSFIGMECI